MLQRKLDNLPSLPGVYIFKDSEGRTIYVGKALSLKHRVRSYFQQGRPIDAKTTRLIAETEDLDYILTDNEVLIYDYKTFSVEPTAIPELAQEYHEHQLQVYARAAAALYPDRKVKTFLLFTSIPTAVPTG